MQIVGPNFCVALSLRDGTAIKAARPVSYMENWPLDRVLKLCKRWHWQVVLNHNEQAQQVHVAAEQAEVSVVAGPVNPRRPA